MNKAIIATENFQQRLTWWIQIADGQEGDESARLNLVQACRAVWNNTDQIPEPYWHEVRDAIGNWKDANEWEKSGHKYSVAARHITARLKKQSA